MIREEKVFAFFMCMDIHTHLFIYLFIYLFGLDVYRYSEAL